MDHKIRIWHFSDTHMRHSKIKPPDDIDIAIFSGDCSNPRDKYANEQEVLNFLCWYGMEVKSAHKIFVAGNHDTSIEGGFVNINKFKEHGILYLENQSTELHFTVNPVTQETRSLKIWGSPISPSFGEGWAFNRKRDKLYNLWQTIPEDTDIVITHGPPKGVLDLAYNGAGELEFCGCNALKNRILEIQPLILMYGHIHDNDNIINAGYTKLSEYKTIFSNGSIVRDGDFNGRLNPGNIFEI